MKAGKCKMPVPTIVGGTVLMEEDDFAVKLGCEGSSNLKEA